MRSIAKVTFKLPFVVEKDAGLFISHCPLLDVYSQGSNGEEAVENLVEAIQLFIETCVETGSIESVMSICGFVKDNENNPSEQDADYLDVPVSLLIQAGNSGSTANC